MFRSKTQGGKLPNTECSLVQFLETHYIGRHVEIRFSLIGITALPDAFHLEIQKEAFGN